MQLLSTLIASFLFSSAMATSSVRLLTSNCYGSLSDFQAAVDLANTESGVDLDWDGVCHYLYDSLDVNSLLSDTFDYLFITSYKSTVLSTSERLLLDDALNNGRVKKVVVFDANPNFATEISGLPYGSASYFLDYSDYVDPVYSSDKPSEGPAGTVGSYTACYASHGLIASDSSRDEVYVSSNNVLPVFSEYCFGQGQVYYSTMPMEAYLFWNGGLDYCGGDGNGGIKSKQLVANTLAMLEDASYGCNSPPVCPNVVASQAWVAPNNKFFDVSVEGFASDPENSTLSVIVTSCDSSDPARAKFGPDCLSVDDTTVSLRAKRYGFTDGRLYRIGYNATDDGGLSCSGYAYVCIPHDASILNVGESDISDLILSGESAFGHKKLCPSAGEVTWFPQF